MSRQRLKKRVASVLIALAVAFYGVQASSPRCRADALCCPKKTVDSPNDELVNPLPPCCEHSMVQRISVQPTTRHEGSTPLTVAVLCPAVDETSPILSRLSRPTAAAPLNLQPLYKRKCVLLL